MKKRRYFLLLQKYYINNSICLSYFVDYSVTRHLLLPLILGYDHLLFFADIVYIQA